MLVTRSLYGLLLDCWNPEMWGGFRLTAGMNSSVQELSVNTRTHNFCKRKHGKVFRNTNALPWCTGAQTDSGCDFWCCCSQRAARDALSVSWCLSPAENHTHDLLRVSQVRPFTRTFTLKGKGSELVLSLSAGASSLRCRCLSDSWAEVGVS